MKVKFSKDPLIREAQERVLRIGKDSITSRKALENQTEKEWEERQEEKNSVNLLFDDEKTFNSAKKVFQE